MSFINLHIEQIGNPITSTLIGVFGGNALRCSSVFDEIWLQKC